MARTRWISRISLALGALVIAPSMALAEYHIDRWYRMGDDTFDTGVGNGQPVTVTADSVGPTNPEFNDLTAMVNTTDPLAAAPQYIDISASRPVAGNTGNTYAIQFDGLGGYLSAQIFSNPSQSATAATQGYATNAITDRGYQLWVLPTNVDGVAEYVIDDGDRHSNRIGTAGFFTSEINNTNAVASAPAAMAANNQWTHLMQVRPDDVSGGSALFANGLFVASNSGNYDLSNSAASATTFVVGGNAEPGVNLGDPTVVTEFFQGVVDEIQVFVFDDGTNYGKYNYAQDNGYFTDVFLPSQNAFYSYVHNSTTGHNNKAWVEGDINFDGTFNTNDVNAFVAGWLSRRGDVPGAGPNTYGDYSTLALGDLDFDGDTDLGDWVVLRDIATPAGVALPPLFGSTVPEPSTLVVAGLALAGLALGLRRRQ